MERFFPSTLKRSLGQQGYKSELGAVVQLALRLFHNSGTSFYGYRGLIRYTHRYQSSLEFPILDSFPSIYLAPPSGRTSLATRTSLSIESSVVDRIQRMQAVVGRYVGPDERETLLNGLGEIADTFQSGWSSNGESAGEDEL